MAHALLVVDVGRAGVELAVEQILQRLAGVLGVVAAAGGALGQRLSGGVSPSAVALPSPVEALPPLPAGLEESVRRYVALIRT